MEDEATLEIYRNWAHGLAMWTVTLFKVGKEIAGETFIQRVEEEFAKSGVNVARKYGSLSGETGSDAQAIGRILDMVDESMGNFCNGYEENSPQAFEKHILTCPVAEIFSQEPEICSRLAQATAQGLVSSINPNAHFRLDELLCKGAESCHYRVDIRQD